MNGSTAGKRVASPLTVPMLILGWLLLAAGCTYSTATVVGNDYRPVLLAAIYCAGGALIPLAFAIWRGHVVVRILAGLGVVPLVFIVGEFIGRYH